MTTIDMDLALMRKIIQEAVTAVKTLYQNDFFEQCERLSDVVVGFAALVERMGVCSSEGRAGLRAALPSPLLEILPALHQSLWTLNISHVDEILWEFGLQLAELQLRPELSKVEALDVLATIWLDLGQLGPALLHGGLTQLGQLLKVGQPARGYWILSHRLSVAAQPRAATYMRWMTVVNRSVQKLLGLLEREQLEALSRILESLEASELPKNLLST